MHQWRKGIAKWECGNTLYLSVPFTWLLEEAEKERAAWKKGHVLVGGPAIGAPNECEGFEPVLFHNPSATFTTRGCVNQCSFCSVPIIEPEFREIPDFRPAPMVCDNNLLAASKIHLHRVVDKLKVFPYVDFNQGLEAKRFTPEVADLFGNLKCKIRFAFDGWYAEQMVKDAIDLCKKRTSKDIGIYVLIGYNDTPEDAKARLELVRSWGVLPNPMRYQPLDAHAKNCYVAPGWTERELRKMARYYSRLTQLGGIPYDDYQYTEQGILFPC